MEARFFGVNVRGRVLDAEERLPRDAVVRRSLKGVGSGRVQRLRVIVALEKEKGSVDNDSKNMYQDQGWRTRSK